MQLLAPREVSDEEILQLLDSDDGGGFRIPMSIGEPHAELDHGECVCVCVCLCVHPCMHVKIDHSIFVRCHRSLKELAP